MCFKVGTTALMSNSTGPVSVIILKVLNYSQERYYVKFDGDVYPDTYIGTEAYAEKNQLTPRNKSSDYAKNVAELPLKLATWMPEWQAKWCGEQLINAIKSVP